MDGRNVNFREPKEMNREMQKEKEIQHKRRVKALLARVSLLAMLLVVSTYAWFTSQKDITLSNIRGTVEVVENMEISLDAKTWYQRIDLSQAEAVFTAAQTSRNIALGENDVGDTITTAVAVLPEQLFPVSSVGKTGVTKLPLYMGEATSTSLSGIVECEEIPEEGYIAFDMYIKNASRDSEADVLQLNINSSAQVLTETISKTITDVYGNEVARTYNGNEASGLQNTVRVALAKYAGEVSSTATQLEILNSTKGANIADIAIWEPNAYDHVESIVSNNNKLIDGTNTEIKFTAYDSSKTLEELELETYALTENAVGQTIENVYNISSTGLEAQNTFKTDNIKDGNEIKSYRIKTENDKPIDIKNTSNNNFEISSNSVTRYRVYIWLEGQDVDCINIASLGGGIELDLGLTKDDEVGDVLTEIDDRVSLSTTELTTEPVTATIKMDGVIAELPTDWTYVDAATKLEIKKVYSANEIEQVEIKTEDGKITKIEVTINNIDTLAKKVIGNENTMYGQYVNYPVDIDGDSTNYDWQIFYANGENVFIIADDYVLNSKLTNNEMTKCTTSTYLNYCSYIGDDQLVTTSIDSSVANKYLLRQAKPVNQENYYATAHFLNTNIWNTNFKNAAYAESAIGTPTLEMFMDSWNKKFNGDSNYSQMSYAWVVENISTGYMIGTTSPTEYTISVNGYNEENAKMYWPHTTGDNIDGTSMGDCIGYWLAAPAVGGSNSAFYINYGGGVYNMPYDSDGKGIRPVVSLISGIKATKVDDVWGLSSN